MRSLEPVNAKTFPRVSPALIESSTAALERLEGLVKRIPGSRLRAAPRKVWEDFFALPRERQEAAIRGWNAQSELLELAEERGIDYVDEPSMLQFAMGHLKLLGDSDVFARVEKDDLVEILDPDLLQVYRSYNYFALCNYSLLELGCYPYFELYERSSQVEDVLTQAGERLLAGSARWVDLTHVPDYTIRELMTEEGALFSMRERMLVKTLCAATGETYIISVKKVRALGEGPGNVRFI